MPFSIDQGLGILVWSPLAGGLLSGKYARGVEAPAGSRQLGGWNEPPVYDEDKLYNTIDVLKEIASGHGVSAAQVALAWSLGRPGVTSLIVGARTDEQLADNLKAAELVLSADERGKLDDVSKQALRVSALAPGEDRARPAERGRSRVARALPFVSLLPATLRKRLMTTVEGGHHDARTMTYGETERRHLVGRAEY